MLIKVDWNSKKSLKEAVAPKLNDNFWKWFGNSKVVDKKGNPLVVYHGTTKKFDVFKSNNPTLDDDFPKGIYFSSSRDNANTYGYFDSTVIIPAYLRIKNPFELNANGKTYNDFYDELYSKIRRIKKSVYDGIIIYNIRDDNQQFDDSGEITNTYIVFNPNQIKSVDNNGNWSLTSDNIYETLTESSEPNLNQNFWNWFKGSKTVDEQGNPLIFYHGTKQPNITNFKAKYDDGLVFFAYNEEFAKQWASHAPLTPEQEEKTREFMGSDDLVNYRKEVMARYKRDYGDNWADDDDIRSAAKWEIKEYEKQKYKQMGIEENVMPVYIRATKIFNPERDYEQVIDKIAEHWDIPLKPMYEKEEKEAQEKFNKIHDTLMTWFKNHLDWANDPVLEKEFKKREDILDNAFKELEAIRNKNITIKNHLSRIKKGAWIYFENKETIDKIWELGYDAIELSEHSGVITTLAVREGTNQIKSIFNDGSWSNKTNIFEEK